MYVAKPRIWMTFRVFAGTSRYRTMMMNQGRRGQADQGLLQQLAALRVCKQCCPEDQCGSRGQTASEMRHHDLVAVLNGDAICAAPRSLSVGKAEMGPLSPDSSTILQAEGIGQQGERCQCPSEGWSLGSSLA